MRTNDPLRTPVAYKNEEFLDSDDARPLRILAEYLEPMHAFQRERICAPDIQPACSRKDPGRCPRVVIASSPSSRQ